MLDDCVVEFVRTLYQYGFYIATPHIGGPFVYTVINAVGPLDQSVVSDERHILQSK